MNDQVRMAARAARRRELSMASKVTIVLGVIGADCHAVANKILYHTFTEAGFKAAIETDAKAILVSSLYGHAEMDCHSLRERCI